MHLTAYTYIQKPNASPWQWSDCDHRIKIKPHTACIPYQKIKIYIPYQKNHIQTVKRPYQKIKTDHHRGDAFDCLYTISEKSIANKNQKTRLQHPKVKKS